MLDGCYNMVWQTTYFEYIVLRMQQHCDLAPLPYHALSLQMFSCIESSVLHLRIMHATCLS